MPRSSIVAFLKRRGIYLVPPAQHLVPLGAVGLPTPRPCKGWRGFFISLGPVLSLASKVNAYAG